MALFRAARWGYAPREATTMRQGLAWLLLLPLVREAAPAPPLDASPSARIVKQVGDDYLAWLREDDLSLRAKLGLPIEKLPDVSLEKERRDAEKAAGLLARLDEAILSELEHEEALSVDVLRRQLKALVDLPAFHRLAFPVTPYASPLGGVNQAFAGFAIPDEPAAGRYLALLRQHPRFVASLRARLEDQAASGIRIPRDELDLVVPFLRSLVGGADTSPLGVKPDRLASLPAERAKAFRSELDRLLEAEVNPPLRQLADWLAGEYRERAPEGVGLAQYPGGREFYGWLVRWHTTMDVTPEQVHQIGLDRVAAIESEMQAVRARLGFKGSKAEFRQLLRSDPRFFPRTPEEIGARLMSHVRRIEPRVDAFFVRKPRAPYGVKRLEPEREPAQTFGYYQLPGAADATGYYRFNGSSLSDRSLLNSAALIYHELVPGHHFQINLASENEAIPAFRRETFDTAYTEGWGEYASALAGEMEMYADPHDLYGRLAMEMFITTRLVVDTGMNALGWSRQRAVEFMREHLMETDTQIQTESLRYSTDIPGQALAYKMGALRIQELREKAHESLGERFDIRRFHDAVLGSGSLPMTTLERHVDWFIEQERRR
jgi:uncharacterized protein (DUF885 family)